MWFCWSGANFPTATFPSVVGRPMLRTEHRVDYREIKDIIVGEEATNLNSMLSITYPVRNGVITNWEDITHICDYSFNEKLKINLQECKILLTEPAMNPLLNRQTMVETMFEKYHFKGVRVAVQAVLTLYAQGLLTGVVVDIGDGVTHVVPVYEGFALPHLDRRLDIAGHHVTNYLIDLLLLRGYAFNRSADWEVVKQIKEKHCYVAYDVEKEETLANDTTQLVESFTLPDGRVIKIGSERFRAPEILFKPHLIGMDEPGLADLLFNSISKADMELRSELLQHIVLSGGSTMYPGLPSRLEKEINTLYLNKVLKGDASKLAKLRCRIEDPPRRKHMVFLGGAVLASIMKDKPEFWISRKEYEEKGIHALSL